MYKQQQQNNLYVYNLNLLPIIEVYIFKYYEIWLFISCVYNIIHKYPHYITYTIYNAYDGFLSTALKNYNILIKID